MTASAVGATLALLATGCSSEPTAEPAADQSPTAEPVSAAPTEPADPYAVPDEVTPEYVDLVVNAIYGRMAQITRGILDKPVDPQATPTAEMVQQIGALADGQHLELLLAVSEGAIRSREARDKLLPAAEYGQFRFHTVAVTRADAECIVAIGWADSTGTASDGGSDDELHAISLRPIVDGIDPLSVNPTPWMIMDLLANRDPDGDLYPDEKMLEADVEDFGTSLENTCGAA